MTDERMAKLPKWAQQEIKRLESDLQSARAELAFATGEVASPVTWGHRRYKIHGIPPNETIYFGLPDGVSLGVCIDRQNKRRLYVSMDGGDRLRILPAVSNAFYIEADGYVRSTDPDTR